MTLKEWLISTSELGYTRLDDSDYVAVTGRVLDYDLEFILRTNLDDPILNNITDTEVDHDNKVIRVGVNEK